MDQLMSRKVATVHSKMIEEGKLSPFSLDYIGHLEAVENTDVFVFFYDTLVKRCAKITGTKIKGLDKYALLCLCIRGYKFNSKTVELMNDQGVHSLWRALENSYNMCNLLRDDATMLDELFDGRSAAAYEKIHLVTTKSTKNKSVTVKTHVTSDKLLAERHHNLGKPIGSFKSLDLSTDSVDCISGIIVYMDYSSMILSACGYKPGLIRRTQRGSVCECSSLLEVEDLETARGVPLCIKHGTHSSTRYCILKTKIGSFLLAGSQCHYPSIHVDRCMLMPEEIRSQFDSLLTSLGYNQVRSIETSSNGNRILSPLINKRNIRVRELRQCILIGHVRSKDISVLVWMLRPTLNYATCHIKCKTSEYSAIRALILGAASARGGQAAVQDIDITRKNLGYNDNIEIELSGVGLSYVLTSNTFKTTLSNYKMSSCSIGGSSLNVLLIRHTMDTISGQEMGELLPVFPNIEVYKALTSISTRAASNMHFDVLSNKVVVKFIKISEGRVSGPTVTIGKNGGFQYIGSPNLIAPVFAQLYTHMSLMMNKPEFIRSILNSGQGIMNQYPSGIRRKVNQ